MPVFVEEYSVFGGIGLRFSCHNVDARVMLYLVLPPYQILWSFDGMEAILGMINYFGN